MPRHIGIAAAPPRLRLGYRTLCIEGAGRSGGHAHPEVSLHAPSLADHVACLDRGDGRVVPRSPLPWLQIAASSRRTPPAAGCAGSACSARAGWSTATATRRRSRHAAA